VVLSLGVIVGAHWLVNPLLAGLAVWLTFRLGQKLLGNRIGLLAAALTVVSPLFLTYTGSLLSHTFGLVLSLCFALAWLDTVDEQNLTPGWLPTLSAGFSLGLLALSRPWTALGVAIPFGVDGLIRLWRGSASVRKQIIAIGLIAAAIASLHFLWQYALTGDALTNPYTLWWRYDRVGFGINHGPREMGHTLRQGWLNTRHSLILVGRDLFGWGQLGWLLPLLGLWKLRRRRKAWLLACVFPALVLVYIAYWVSGPRYFYEGLYSLTFLSAAGIAWLAGWFDSSKEKALLKPRLRQMLVLGLLGLGLILSAVSYTPARLNAIQERYGFHRDDLEAFQTTAFGAKTPALIFVHTEEWKEYGALLHLQDPQLTTPFIFYWASGGDDAHSRLADHFPDRCVYRYYPDNPKPLLIVEPVRE
jgi:4-amino-4-deoxy-L-arabinose transferase-like glycosyltransferase